MPDRSSVLNKRRDPPPVKYISMTCSSDLFTKFPIKSISVSTSRRDLQPPSIATYIPKKGTEKREKKEEKMPSYSTRPPVRPAREQQQQQQQQQQQFDNDPMHQLQSANTVHMSPELFEKLFLQAQQNPSARRSPSRWSLLDDEVNKGDAAASAGNGGDWRKAMGNPTPM